MLFFDEFFRMPSARERHNLAPLAAERAAYLSHLAQSGRSRSTVHQTAVHLLHINRFLGFTKGFRDVFPDEIQAASEAWQSYKGPLVNRNRQAGRWSSELFRRVARGWLRFNRCLVVPEKSRSSEKSFLEFKVAMRDRFGLAPSTIDTRLMHVSFFLIWLNQRRVQLRHTTIQHVERYLEEKSRKTWSLDTTILAAQSIKGFLRFAGENGWVRPGIYPAVPKLPRPKHHFVKKGPEWKDVRRMLSSLCGNTHLQMRQRAIALLIANYGFRSGEIVGLKLGEVDLPGRVLTVRRGKNFSAQRFPLSREIAVVLKRYIDGRPTSSSAALFVSSLPPFGPLTRTSIHDCIRRLFLKNRVQSVSKGPHALRHACADRLMQTGSSVYEIAEYLGQKEVDSVRSYARYDVDTLRPVANFSLKGLM